MYGCPVSNLTAACGARPGRWSRASTARPNQHFPALPTMQEAVVVALALLLPLAVLVASTYMVIKRLWHYQDQIDLHAPLLDSDDNNRMNNALREAKATTQCCSLCAFENPLRNEYCSLCGKKLPRAEVKRTGIGRWISNQKKGATGKDDAPVVLELTSRQRRARNRKEWIRVLQQTDEGESHADQLVWKRTCSSDKGITSDLDQGIVAKFLVPESAGEEPFSEEDEQAPSLLDEIVVEAAGNVNENEGQASSPLNEIAVEETDPNHEENEVVSVPLDEIIVEGSNESNNTDGAAAKEEPTLALSPRKLQPRMDELKNTKVELLSVNGGVAASIGFGATAAEHRSPREIADFTAADFPSKYAYFVASTATLLSDNAEKPRVLLKTTREDAYERSMVFLSQLPTKRLRSPLQIHFEGESGVDAGGLLREWTTVVAQGLVVQSQRSALDDSSPTPPRVFAKVDTEDEAYHLFNEANVSDDEAVAFAYAAGRFVGRALLGGNLLGFHLSLPLLKMIVGVPVTFSDLEFFDSENFRSLSWLLEHDGVDALDLDFTVSDTKVSAADGGTSQTIRTRELLPGGASIQVTDANKFEFVSLKLRDMVFGRVERMLYPFLKGLYEVVPSDLLALFDPEELDYLISGSDEIDVEDWKRNTKYSEELYGHDALRWFWELVEEMPTEYRRRLLQFATGSSRVPLGGFAALTSYDGRVSPFTLQGISYRSSGGNILSHACFNRLDLPLYWERSRMKSVLYAILSSDDSVGFTMQ